MCRGHVQFPAFASNTLLLLPALQKVAVGFLVFSYCFVHNLAQLISSKLFLVPYTFCWRRKWQSTAVFLPGKSYGWRSLTGYSPWSHKELAPTFPALASRFFTTEPPGKPSKVLGTILVVCVHGHYISVKYTYVIYFSHNPLILPSLSASLSPSSPFILHRMVMERPYDF